MLYNPPSGSTDSNAPYVGKDTAAGRQGSKLPPAAAEHPQREIIAIIAAAQAMGMPAPSGTDLSQMLKAVRSGLLNRYVGTGSPDAIAIAPSPAYVALIEGMRFRVKVPGAGSNATATPTLGINSLSAPIKRRDGSAAVAGDLVSGIVVEFEIDAALNARIVGASAAEILSTVAASGQVPIVLQTPTLYVRTDGNDATGDGSANTAAKAFATIAAAIAFGAKRYYLAGGTLTIKLGVAGTYAAPGAITGVNGTVAIVGDTANQSSYIIQGAGPVGGSSGLVAAYACQVTLAGVRIYNTGSINSSVNAFLRGSWTVNNVDFVSNSQTSNYAHMGVGTGGSGFLGQGCTITGGLGYAINASSGVIQIGPYTTTVIGTPAFAGAFVIAGSMAAVVTTGGASFSGPATGARFYVSNLALISAGGGGANFFPGNVAGAQVNASGGYYAN